MAIKLQEKNGAIDLTQKMFKGDDGGYYIPSVDKSGNLTWKATEEDMESVPGINIKGPTGETGPQGAAGKDGRDTVWTGDEEPGEEYNVWIAPGGSASNLITQEQMESYVEEQIANIDIPEQEATVAVDNKTIIQNEDGTISTFVGGWLEDIPPQTIFESSYRCIIPADEDVFEGEITEEEAEFEFLKDNVHEALPATVYMTINGEEVVYENIMLDVSSRRVQFVPVDYDDNSIIDTVSIDVRNCGIEIELTDRFEAETRIENIKIEQGGYIYHKIDGRYINVDGNYFNVGDTGAIAINESAITSIAVDGCLNAGFMDEGRVDDMITNRLAEIPIAEEVSV